MYGIALEGGGAKGSYQIGAWKAIEELGLEIGGVAGTSVGAINGALILQETLDEALEIWSTIEPSQLFDVDHTLLDRMRKLEKLPGNMARYINYFQAAVQDKGIDIRPLRNLLEKHIDEEKIRKTKKDFGLVTISLSDRTPVEIFLEEIPEGELVDYILASSRLPIFQSDFVDGKRYLDGGFYNNLPINMLISRGYKEIIAIMIGGLGVHRKVRDKGINIIAIQPKENLGAILEFNPDRVRTNIDLGYYDTLRVFRGYRGQRYYIKDVPNDDYFIAVLAKLPQERMNDLLTKLKLPGDDLYLRSIFEKMMPAVARTLKLDNQCNYGDIIIALIERIAQTQKIERFRIYSFSELLSVLDPRQLTTPPPKSKLVRILKRSDLLPWSLRQEIFSTLSALLIQTMQKGFGPEKP